MAQKFTQVFWQLADNGLQLVPLFHESINLGFSHWHAS